MSLKIIKAGYLVVLLLAFESFGKTYAQAPKLNSFSPTSGTIGTRVTINGSGFSPIADSNAVYFGATRAIVNNAVASQLLVTVPPGATYKPITVINKISRLSGSSTLAFLPGFAPVTTGIDKPVRLVPNMPASDVQAGDIDGDGKTDLIATNTISHTLMVFYNKSTAGVIDTGSFAQPLIYKTGPQPAIAAINDLDGDGKPDLVLMNVGYSIIPNGNNSLTLFHNISTPTHIKLAAVPIIDSSATVPASYNFQLKPGDNVARVSDFDGDGKPDIAVLNSAGFITIYHNTYSAGQPLKNILGLPVIFPVAANPTSFTIGDVDGDGKLDIITTNYANSSMTILRNSSTTGSVSFQRADFPLGYHPLSISLADVDGDGKSDILISGPDNKTTLFHNTTTPGHFGGTGINLTNLHITGNFDDDIVMQDISGDGKPDLLTLNTTLDSVYLYTNKSAPGQTSADYFNTKLNLPIKTIPDCVADLDGDGRPDMIVGSYFGIDIYHSKYSQIQPPPVVKDTVQSELVVYPNPTVLSTNVKYSLAVKSQVLISVYSAAGRLLKTYKTAEMPAGNYTNAIETANLRTGVYFITIKAANYNKSAKLIIQ